MRGGGGTADPGLSLGVTGEDSPGEGELLCSRVGLAPGQAPGLGRATWGQSAEGDVGTAGASLGSSVENEADNPTSGFFGFTHFLQCWRAEFGHTPLMAFGRKSPHNRPGGMETPFRKPASFFLSWAFFQNTFYRPLPPRR